MTSLRSRMEDSEVQITMGDIPWLRRCENDAGSGPAKND